MKINRAVQIPWALLVLAATGLATLLYLAEFYPQSVSANLRFFGETPPGHATIGGTPLGLVLGTISFGIFIFAALLGMRKRLPALFPGHVQTWLRAHIWLTLLTVPLILLHCGFHLGSPMTTLLMGLYAVVMLSGVYGLILQQKLPRLMKEQLPAEIVYEQIRNVRMQRCAEAKTLLRGYEARRKESAPVGAAAGSAPLREDEAEESEKDLASEAFLIDFLQRQLLPYLEARRGKRFPLSHVRTANDTFHYLKLRVAASYREAVEAMERWSNERRLQDAQVKMQHWLHGWLFVHVPFSFLLILLTAWHAFVTLFRY
ncbi:MAG: hypothetical protein ABI992_01950 [Chthoniobacterales bacterium]